MIDIKELSKEHAALFPNATAESQLYKLEEEIKELEDAKTNTQVIKELADIVIVCAGLYRWFKSTALVIDFYFAMLNKFIWHEVVKEVDRKWQVNKARKWEWNGKTYKHIGVDGNE